MGAKQSLPGGVCKGAYCDAKPEDALPRNLLAGLFVAQSVVVFASNAGYLGGLTNVEIGKRYGTLAMPAGWAFAIWGLIYTWEAVAHAAILFATPHPSPQLETAAPALCVAHACQLLWAVAFCREQLEASALFIGALACALWTAAAALHGAPEARLVGVVTSIHAGWVAAASLLNVNLCLVKRGAGKAAQLGAAFATCYGAVFAGAIACATTGDAPFAFALAWALLAIGVELSASKPAAAFDGTAVAALRGTALAGAGVLVWLAVAAVAFEYVVEPWHS